MNLEDDTKRPGRTELETTGSAIEKDRTKNGESIMKKKIKLLVDFLGQKAGTILEVDEADATSAIELKKAELYVETKDPATESQKAVDDLLTKFQEGLNGIMVEAGKAVVASAKKNAAAAKKGVKNLVVAGGTARNDDEESWGYENLGEFAKDTKLFSDKGKTSDPERLKGYMDKVKAVTGMSEQVGEDGAVLVPTQLAAGIYERVFDQQNLVAQCDVYNLTGNSIVFPGLADDSRATGSRWGGVRGYWMGEAQQLTNSKPKFTEMKLRLHKLGVMIYTTDELLSDSAVALDQFLTRKAGDEINFMASDAIINGNGVNKPLGILNSPGLISIARTAVNHIKFEDISNMWNRMWSPFRSTAAWYVNQEVEPELDRLTFNVKNAAGSDNVGGWPLYIPPGGLNDSPYGMLKGRPVIPLEYCPALGTKGDILLTTMSQYLVGTKAGIQAAMSIHLRFDYDETAFRFTYRIDGQPWWNKPVTPFKGTSTYSPYVSLLPTT